MFADLTHAGAPALAAFLASLVEAVEALTVILAVGVMRGWRSSLAGAALAVFVLAAVTTALGPALKQIPLDLAKVVIGALLVLFGLRWLRKATLRAAGVIPLHDEQAVYDRETRGLAGLSLSRRRWDGEAIATTFKITMIEGLEVVFIVIAIGAGGSGALAYAAVGAVFAIVAAALTGFALHRPLTKVPENSLKFAVGVLLSALSTFWVGEGFGLRWPGDDASILLLVCGFLAAALVGVHRLRQHAASGAASTIL